MVLHGDGPLPYGSSKTAVSKEAPDHVFLQNHRAEETTWCQKQINSDDVEYVRADLVVKGWIPGIPKNPEPDCLYAVMSKPEVGCAVAGVIRGGDCNWGSKGIIAHYPMPLSMDSATALKLIRTGRYDFQEASE